MADTFAGQAVRRAAMAGWLLHWPPETFWRATPSELAEVLAVGIAAAGGGDGAAAPDAAAIARLKERFPDG